jgi:hypothetical protein
MGVSNGSVLTALMMMAAKVLHLFSSHRGNCGWGNLSGHGICLAGLVTVVISLSLMSGTMKRPQNWDFKHRNMCLNMTSTILESGQCWHWRQGFVQTSCHVSNSMKCSDMCEVAREQGMRAQAWELSVVRKAIRKLRLTFHGYWLNV